MRSRPRSWRAWRVWYHAPRRARARRAVLARVARRARCPGGAAPVEAQSAGAVVCAASCATSTSAARSSSSLDGGDARRGPVRRGAGAAARPATEQAMTLLLTIDVGNTNTVLGVHEGDDAERALAAHHAPRADRGRVRHPRPQPLRRLRTSTRGRSVGVALASVVPPLTLGAGRAVARSTSGQDPLVVEPGVRTGHADPLRAARRRGRRPHRQRRGRLRRLRRAR